MLFQFFSVQPAFLYITANTLKAFTLPTHQEVLQIITTTPCRGYCDYFHFADETEARVLLPTELP